MKGLLGEIGRFVWRDLVPHKSLAQVIEEQNTKTVWLPGTGGFPKKYVYGKVPGKPLVEHDFHPEPRVCPHCKPEQDESVVGEHIAICSREPGTHGGLCEMCKKLSNPKRMDFLVRLYRGVGGLCDGGMNVGHAQDGSQLFQPATSEYMRQLADLGMIRRERSGRLVNYYPDYSNATWAVREIAAMIMRRLREQDGNMSFVPIFHVMMGRIRARIVRFIAAGGCGCVEYLAEKFELRQGDLRHFLKFAEEGQILRCNSDDPDGVYEYITPADPIARRVVELS